MSIFNLPMLLGPPTDSFLNPPHPGLWSLLSSHCRHNPGGWSWERTQSTSSESFPRHGHGFPPSPSACVAVNAVTSPPRGLGVAFLQAAHFSEQARKALLTFRFSRLVDSQSGKPQGSSSTSMSCGFSPHFLDRNSTSTSFLPRQKTLRLKFRPARFRPAFLFKFRLFLDNPFFFPAFSTGFRSRSQTVAYPPLNNSHVPETCFLPLLASFKRFLRSR